MATQEILFPGKNEIEQLHCIFHWTGTPTEQIWPNWAQVCESSKFPEVARRGFQEFQPVLGESGVDLLERLLILDPAARITAKEALQHRFFADI
jgi:serine/threonine protein kinase